MAKSNKIIKLAPYWEQELATLPNGAWPSRTIAKYTQQVAYTRYTQMNAYTNEDFKLFIKNTEKNNDPGVIHTFSGISDVIYKEH